MFFNSTYTKFIFLHFDLLFYFLIVGVFTPSLSLLLFPAAAVLFPSGDHYSFLRSLLISQLLFFE